jgi:hypothetical protein
MEDEHDQYLPDIVKDCEYFLGILGLKEAKRLALKDVADNPSWDGIEESLPTGRYLGRSRCALLPTSDLICYEDRNRNGCIIDDSSGCRIKKWYLEEREKGGVDVEDLLFDLQGPRGRVAPTRDEMEWMLGISASDSRLIYARGLGSTGYVPLDNWKATRRKRIEKEEVEARRFPGLNFD